MAKITDQILSELKEIKHKQSEHTVQLAVYNTELKDHTRRSTNLEARVLPIEDHVKFIRKSSKLLTALVALLAGVATVLRYLH